MRILGSGIPRGSIVLVFSPWCWFARSQYVELRCTLSPGRLPNARWGGKSDETGTSFNSGLVCDTACWNKATRTLGKPNSLMD
ncbi:hypothetical protein TMatcc_009374 [Talaromyces marneffei ATCC 18224]